MRCVKESVGRIQAAGYILKMLAVDRNQGKDLKYG